MRAVIGEIAALAAALAFGMNTVLARRFMVAVAPEAGVLVSIAANVVVFWSLLGAVVWRGDLPPVNPASIWLFALGGLAGTLVGRNLAYHGIKRLGPSLSTSLRLSNSVFTLLFGYLLLRELPRSWQLAGMVAVTLGLWYSLRPEEGSLHERRRSVDLRGVAIVLGAAAAFALGDSARRIGLVLTPSPFLGTAVGATVAFSAHLLWSVFNRSARLPRGPDLRRADLLGSAACNTAAILLLFVGLTHAPVAIVSVLYNLQVLIVLIVSPLLLPGQETITPRIVWGALLALAGTALILLG